MASPSAGHSSNVRAVIATVRFDTAALYEALDAQRRDRGLSWAGVAREFWNLDAALNASRPDDHPFSASTIVSMRERRATSCQHALFMLRWLAPEHFLGQANPYAGTIVLPATPTGRRLRWSLKRLYAALNEKRLDEGLTWLEVAESLECTRNQLTGLRTAKFATSIDLAVRIVQCTERPSIEFMFYARW
jgi:hypothetical protein